MPEVPDGLSEFLRMLVLLPFGVEEDFETEFFLFLSDANGLYFCLFLDV